MTMPYAVGIALGIIVGVLGTSSRMDRDRAFYPTIMIVIASYYALFAVMGATSRVLIIECLAGMVFLAAAVAGFKSSLWIVAAAIAGHGVFDFLRGDLISNPGAPVWWPAFCGTIDIVLGSYLAFLLWRRIVPARQVIA